MVSVNRVTIRMGTENSTSRIFVDQCYTHGRPCDLIIILSLILTLTLTLT